MPSDTATLTPPPPTITEPPITALAPQTEAPGPMTPAMLALQDLIENPPLIAGLAATSSVTYFKCNLKVRRWFELAKYGVNDYNEEINDGWLSRTTFVEVTFTTRNLRAYTGGCGYGPLDRAHGDLTLVCFGMGRRMIGGTINPHAPTFPIHFDRARGIFVVEGRAIIGAEAIILGDDCRAVVLGPKFQQP